jgi:ubiquinone/menaquinone biosynthesis C-methylase UbiE
MNSSTYNLCPVNHESIFERCAWFYAFCRELLFMDHTDDIVASLLPLLHQPFRPVLFEVGCGPGFYSSRLAKRFPQLDVVGIDPSEGLLTLARRTADRHRLTNCRFVRAHVQQLSDSPETADFIIASRLFLILINRGFALQAVYTALKPNGILFIAEPISSFRAALPLACMHLLQRLNSSRKPLPPPVRCHVLDTAEFAEFVGSQPWKRVRRWSDRRYQYALCEKSQ